MRPRHFSLAAAIAEGSRRSQHQTARSELTVAIAEDSPPEVRIFEHIFERTDETYALKNPDLFTPARREIRQN